MSEWSLRVIAVWLECFPEKSSWYQNEQLCQGRQSVKRFLSVQRIGYCAIYRNISFST